MQIYVNWRKNDATDRIFSPKGAQLLFKQLQKNKQREPKN